MRNDDWRQLFGRQTSIRALLANPDIKLIGMGLLIVLVGYLKAE